MALDNRRCILRSPTPVIEPGTISACTMRLPRIVARAVIVMRPAKSRPGASGGGIFEQCAAALFDVGRAGAVGVGACGTMLTGAGGGVCVAVIVGGGDGAWICTSGGGMNGGGGAANEGGGGTTRSGGGGGFLISSITLVSIGARTTSTTFFARPLTSA